MLLVLGHKLLSWCLCSWACLACCFLLCPYISCLCCVTNNPKYSEFKKQKQKTIVSQTNTLIRLYGGSQNFSPLVQPYSVCIQVCEGSKMAVSRPHSSHWSTETVACTQVSCVKWTSRRHLTWCQENNLREGSECIRSLRVTVFLYQLLPYCAEGNSHRPAQT